MQHKYFYSHAHEGRDVIWFRDEPDLLISTHTPTRGVTKLMLIFLPLFEFLLTRPRGA